MGIKNIVISGIWIMILGLSFKPMSQSTANTQEVLLGGADICEDIDGASTIDELITDPNFSDIYIECIEGTMLSSSSETVIDNCGANNLPTVWFKITTDDIAAQLVTSITNEGGWTPIWSIYASPTDTCTDLTLIQSGTIDNPIACGQGDDVFSIAVQEFEGIPINTYFLALSAEGGIVQLPQFELCAYTKIGVDVCLGELYTCDESPDYEIYVTERDNLFGSLEGPYCPGETLEICVDFFYNGSQEQNEDVSGVASDWLSGIVPNFGSGWDYSSFKPTEAALSPAGAAWYVSGASNGPIIKEKGPHLCTFVNDNGILEVCNLLCEACPCSGGCIEALDTLPSGWFWVTEGDLLGCDNDGSPGEGYGVGQSQVQVNLCFEISVATFDTEEECIANNDLTIGIQTFSHGLVGCWEDPIGECLIDKKQIVNLGEIECNNATKFTLQVDVLNTQCGVDSAVVNINVVSIDVDAPVERYILRDPNFVIIDTFDSNDVNFVAIQEGQYSIEVIEPAPNCIYYEYFTIVFTPIIDPTLSTLDTVCAGESVLISLDNAQDYVSYVWGYDNSTDASIEVFPSETGTYYVTVTDFEGCTGVGAVKVQVKELPDTDIFGSSTYCTGGSTFLAIDNIYGVFGYEIVWKGPEMFTDSNTSSIEVNQSGWYHVTVTNPNGCTGTDSVNVTESDSLTIQLDIDDRCNGQKLISAGVYFSNNYSYQWFIDTGDGFEPTSANYSTGQLLAKKSGVYKVDVGTDGCIGSQSIEVEINSEIDSFFYLTCQNAWENPVCDNSVFDNYCYSMPNFLNDEGPYPLCPTGGVPHNMSWFSFIAGSETIAFEVIPSGCSSIGGNAPGLQSGVYTDCSFESYVFCEPSCLINEFSIVSDNYVLGQQYILFIDGCDGSVCEIDISLIQGSLEYDFPSPLSISEIDSVHDANNPLNICRSEDTIQLKINELDIRTNYYWSIEPPTDRYPDGVIETGVGDLYVDGFYEANIIFDEEGMYIISAFASNPCTTSDTATISVNVSIEDDEIFGSLIVCEEDFPIMGPLTEDPNMDGQIGWQGEILSSYGIFTHKAADLEGCLYTQVIEAVAPDGILETSLDIVFCKGQNVEIAGVTIDESSNNPSFIILQSAAGCDSTITVNYIVIDIDGLLVSTDCVNGRSTISFIAAANIDTTIYDEIQYRWEYVQDPNTTYQDDNDGLGQNLIISRAGTYELYMDVTHDQVECSFGPFTIDVQFDFGGLDDIELVGIWATDVCPGDYIQTYGVAQNNALEYVWQYPSSAIIVNESENTITIDWSQSTGGNLCVQSVMGCSASNVLCQSIISTQIDLPVIMLNDTLCINETVLLTLDGVGQGDFFYDWNFSGAAILNINDVDLNGPGPFELSWSSTGTKSISYELNYLDCSLESTVSTISIIDNDGLAGFTSNAVLCINESFFNLNDFITDADVNGNWQDLNNHGFDIANPNTASLGAVDETGTYQLFYTAGDIQCELDTSILIIELVESQTQLIDIKLCQGDIIIIGDSSFSIAGVYDIPLVASTGCDSLVTLTLSFYETGESSIDTILCVGDSILIGTEYFLGNLDSTIIVSNISTGCDSLVNINVAVVDLDVSYDITYEPVEGSQTISVNVDMDIDNIEWFPTTGLDRSDTTVVVSTVTDSIVYEVFIGYNDDSCEKIIEIPLVPLEPVKLDPCADIELIDPFFDCPSDCINICGCDGITYNNACEAEHLFGITNYTLGACEKDKQERIIVLARPMDGINDLAIIDPCFMDLGISLALEYPNNQFQVINRWGDVVYSKVSYDNDWSGTTSSNNNLPSGTYFFIFTYDLDSDAKVTGALIIVD